jgi:nicotinate phosphoribosyltransferase
LLDVTFLVHSKIVASNDINESVLLSLHQQGHCIDTFAIGTNLVTCQAQPALGCVYKLVELNGKGRIKLSEEITKVQIPACKNVYRLYGSSGTPLVDLMQQRTEEPPQAGSSILVRHPFQEIKRANVTPSRVEPILHTIFEHGRIVDNAEETFHLELVHAKKYLLKQLKTIRNDHIRFSNPTPYKVSVSSSLYDYMHDMWMDESPIQELS